MAEPTNTPVPSSTPVPASTPRSASPELNGLHHRLSATCVSSPPSARRKRPVVLHLGDPVRYNPDTYAVFSAAFEVVRPSESERERAAFARALRERRWGDFDALFRPFWGSGGEMGRWDAELIDLLPPTVRVFASAGAGFDWADTQYLAEKGIIYCNSGVAAAESVADFAVAMVISTFRHLPWCMGAAVQPYLTGGGSSSNPKDADATATAAHRAFQACHAGATAASHTLRGHVLGLVGLGNIGVHIAAKLGHAAFGMRVRYHDVVRKPAALESRLGIAAADGFHADLDGLLAASDCVVLCCPPPPRGQPPLIGAPQLARLRRGARLVNVARGSLVDEEALADALESGQVGAAALDVHADEPAVHGRLVRLAGLEGGGRVMLTCHNAGGTVETHVGFEELSMRNILAVLAGREAITPVNLQWLRRKGAGDNGTGDDGAGGDGTGGDDLKD